MPAFKDDKYQIGVIGDLHPVKIVNGDKVLIQAKEQTQTGTALTFNDTYNDKFLAAKVGGKSEQISEWADKKGQSTQTNPLTNRVPENRRKFEGWQAVGGAVVTLTQNITVPEWDTGEATRIQTGGGTSAAKYYFSLGAVSADRKVRTLIYIKNTGAKSVRIASNLTASWGDYSAAITIPSGQASNVVLHVLGNGSASVQIQFQALSIGDELDFIAYEPQMFYMDDDSMPDNPWPITSNLPKQLNGIDIKRKVQDYKGDWYEFTLPSDLHGIGDVRDAVEFDRYSHSGFLRGGMRIKIFDGTETITAYSAYNGFSSHNLLGDVGDIYMRAPGLCTHGKVVTSSTSGKVEVWLGVNNRSIYFCEFATVLGISSSDTEAFKSWLAAQYAAGTPVAVVYRLAAPARTPLTFTLNNASTAPECPMEFLTDIVSLDYPAQMYDIENVDVRVTGRHLFDESKAHREVVLRSLPDGTCDIYDLLAGDITRNIKKLKIRDLEWTDYSDVGGLKRWETPPIADKFLSGANVSNLFCSHLKVTPYSEISPWSISERPAYNFLRILAPEGTDKTQMLEAVGDADLYYRLAEPTTETAEPIFVPTYPRTTIAEVNSETPAQAEITATVRVFDRGI